jgi:hypothetical protein
MVPRILRWPLATVLSLSLMLGSFGSVSGVFASSHREAPLTSQDPAVDQTDLFAFVSPDDPESVVLIGNYYPFGTPGGGPNYFRFADDALYAIHISNDGGADADISYVFKFTTTTKSVKNPYDPLTDTFLYNTQVTNKIDDNNVVQKYEVYRFDGGFKGRLTGSPFASGLVAPAPIGPNSQPNYAALANEAITDKGDAGKFFAGTRYDPFFVDLNVFDLIFGLGSGTNSIKGYNVQSIVIKIKAAKITSSGEPVIGVWGTTHRPAVRVIRGENDRVHRGFFHQVSRIGHPLVNEAVVPLGLKDKFNGSQPKNDGRFLPKIVKPELAGLMKALLSKITGFGSVDFSFIPEGNADTKQPGARNDLVTVYLTGILGVNQPKNVVASEMLRLNTSIKPSATENRMGVAAGDAAGFPNGRRLNDDVVDITVQAVAGLLINTLKTPGLAPISPANMAIIGQISDGVDASDKATSKTFPYLAEPNLKTK